MACTHLQQLGRAACPPTCKEYHSTQTGDNAITKHEPASVPSATYSNRATRQHMRPALVRLPCMAHVHPMERHQHSGVMHATVSHPATDVAQGDCYSSALTALTKLAVVPEPPMSGVFTEVDESFSTFITARSNLSGQHKRHPRSVMHR